MTPKIHQCFFNTRFSKELAHKVNSDFVFWKNIVIMGKNDVKVLKHKDTIGN